MTKPPEPLNSKVYLHHIQEIIDKMPAGSLRDHRQAVHDRLCAKIDALPHRVAVALRGLAPTAKQHERSSRMKCIA